MHGPCIPYAFPGPFSPFLSLSARAQRRSNRCQGLHFEPNGRPALQDTNPRQFRGCRSTSPFTARLLGGGASAAHCLSLWRASVSPPVAPRWPLQPFRIAPPVAQLGQQGSAGGGRRQSPGSGPFPGLQAVASLALAVDRPAEAASRCQAQAQGHGAADQLSAVHFASSRVTRRSMPMIAVSAFSIRPSAASCLVRMAF